jgi:uncharacterized protein YaaQ
MKLIIAITRDEESDSIINGLIQDEYRVTRIASTGGFLRRGMTTMMIGVEDEKVDGVIDCIKGNCAPVSDSDQRTTIFVLNVNQFMQV